MNTEAKRLSFKAPISPTGRVGIPKKVREFLELDDEVEYVFDEDRVYLEKPRKE
jgi:bifunctional DNA-binding transcriptional regulator/antitoxin component of YhaV-PrlF toxin-antitoxin module